MNHNILQYINGLSIDWNLIEKDSYLRQITSLSTITELQFPNNVTFFVGENGSGKSTLLEAIAIAYGFSPEGGTLNYRDCHYNDTSNLNTAIRLNKGLKPQYSYFFRAESFFNTALQAESFRYPWESKEQYYARYGGKSFHEQSHGESFLALFRTFDCLGLFLMDEPEAALSPQRQLSLFIHICQKAAAGSQFLIVSHSPILLGIPDAQILSFDDGKVTPCRYEDTTSYAITKMFVNHREEMIRELLPNKNEYF